MREADYIEKLRNDISVGILRSILVANNEPNEIIKQNMLDSISEVRKVRAVVIPVGKKKFKGEITDEDLEDYYFKNSEMFKVSEERTVSVVKMDAKEGEEEKTYELIANIEDELAGGSTLQEVAEKFTLDLVTKDAVTKENDVFAELKTEIFAQQVGEPSGVIEQGQGYAVINIEEIKESRIPELEEIKDKVMRAYKIEQNKKENGVFASKVYNEMNEKGDYRSSARKYGLKTKLLEEFKRDEIASVNFAMYQDSFAASKGEVFGLYENMDGGFYIAILDNISKRKLDDAEKIDYTLKIEKQFEDEIIAQFFRHLQAKYGVKENPNYEPR